MSVLLPLLEVMNIKENFDTSTADNRKKIYDTAVGFPNGKKPSDTAVGLPNGERPKDVLSQIPCNDNPIALFVNRVINMAVLAIALFLAVKRNKGFELGSFLAACCCPLCYIAWAVGMGTKLTM